MTPLAKISLCIITEVYCTFPDVQDGTVTCTSLNDNAATNTPAHMDNCIVVCNPGFKPSHETITCLVVDDVGSFDNALTCEGNNCCTGPKFL